MKVLRVRNVHEALPAAMQVLLFEGVQSESRNGSVIMHPETVSTVYERPRERVMFHPWRDANPFFHFYESLWMLAGRNDVAPLTRYVKRMANFSDDGKTFNAAYGHRWRVLNMDQIVEIIAILKKDRNNRRAALQIWNAPFDLYHAFPGESGKDVACNLMATFQVNKKNELLMNVFCRSNDIIWGCYGANAVHFSMLQEYVARSIECSIGSYTQVSVNWHAYLDIYDKLMIKMPNGIVTEENPYRHGGIKPYPLMTVDRELWDEDVRNFVTDTGKLGSARFLDPFFMEVAMPIVASHDLYKEGEIDQAITLIDTCRADDWALACKQWLIRRKARQDGSSNEQA